GGVALVEDLFDADAPAAMERASAAGEEIRYACWIEHDPGVRGTMGRTYGERTTARLTLEEIQALLADGRVRRIVAAPRARPMLDMSIPEIRADLVHSAAGTPPVYSGFTGAGVVVGIVDTGIDLDHEDFQNGNDTRIRWLWDQTASSVNP